jgi:hypothetical protein
MTVTTEEAERLALSLQIADQPATAEIIRSLAAERDALRADNARLREVLGQTVTLLKEILDAIGAEPAETMLVLRKEGVEVGRITAAECFENARLREGWAER